MQRPKMILFDYGHTLALEPVQDYLRGHRRVIELAAENPLGMTGEALYEYSQRLYAELFAQLRPLDLETDGLKLDACIYDTLRLRFGMRPEEVELERWRATEPIYPMEGVEAFLELCAQLGIRMAIISNLSFSGHALTERIREILPRHIGLFESSSPPARAFTASRRATSSSARWRWRGWTRGTVGSPATTSSATSRARANAGIFPVWFHVPYAVHTKNRRGTSRAASTWP